MADGRDEQGIEELDIAIGMTEDPAAEAIAALRAHQEEMGMRFEDPDAPVAAMPGHGPDEEFG